MRTQRVGFDILMQEGRTRSSGLFRPVDDRQRFILNFNQFQAAAAISSVSATTRATASPTYRTLS